MCWIKRREWVVVVTYCNFPPHSVTFMAPVASSPKRRRVEPEDEYKLDDENDDYVPYVPVAQRRQQKLAQLASRGQTQSAAALRALQEQAEADAQNDEEKEEERRRDRQRKERTLLQEAQEVMKQKAEEGML